MKDKEQDTSYSLLERALDLGDQDAWIALSKHYDRFIRYILNQINMNDNDADDIVQQVMIALTRDLPNYDRNRAKFRTWLGSVVRYTALMHYRKLSAKKERPNQNPLDSEILNTLESEQTIERMIDSEWKAYITSEALKNVSMSYQGKAIEVFKMSLAGKEIQEIVSATGLTTSTVYSFKNRVKKSLLFEVRNLMAQLEGE